MQLFLDKFESHFIEKDQVTRVTLSINREVRILEIDGFNCTVEAEWDESDDVATWTGKMGVERKDNLLRAEWKALRETILGVIEALREEGVIQNEEAGTLAQSLARKYNARVNRK